MSIGIQVTLDEMFCDETFCDEMFCDETFCDEMFCNETFCDKCFVTRRFVTKHRDRGQGRKYFSSAHIIFILYHFFV